MSKASALPVVVASSLSCTESSVPSDGSKPPFNVSRHPDVDARLVVEPGNPAAVLVHESVGAELVVVGSRGHGGFLGLLLGSVSDALIRHAGCPVVVAR